MRFLILMAVMLSTYQVHAKVEGMNELIKQASSQEKRLHRKLLKAIQGSQTAIAYHDKRQVGANSEAIEMVIQMR